ncbi:uncharacterized protein LOC110095559 [Dendrobium catenatum]|uniref:uncharacterized protein LOC110095559 n=1 Tax=Dendrobium catenatum TaxID=906689 RepID=UPI0009F3AAC8|nr:uncharacterized protein LOC110095559 [Dendrobium catenatum]
MERSQIDSNQTFSLVTSESLSDHGFYKTLESIDFGGFVHAVIVEESGRAEPIREGMVHGSSFPMEASKKVESDSKSATEGNAGWELKWRGYGILHFRMPKGA